MSEQEPGIVAWKVYTGFDFLMHVKARDKEEATQKAIAELGWADRTDFTLTVFKAHDTVRPSAARNTFGLFQNHGGVSFGWPVEDEFGWPGQEGPIRPLSRDECLSMLVRMRVWITQPEAAQLADDVGSDLEYVQAQIDDIARILEDPLWEYCSWIEFSASRSNNRDAEEDEARADAYCNALYTSSPYD